MPRANMHQFHHLMLHHEARGDYGRALEMVDRLIAENPDVLWLPFERKRVRRKRRHLTWLGRLGQSTWEPGSPAGFPDVQAEWLAPDGLIKRADLAKIISLRKRGAYDPRDIAGHAFGDQLGDVARGAVAAAGDKAQGLSLLLMSRDFQWR